MRPNDREQCDGSMTTPPSILVVDDEPHVLIMVSVMLRRAGFEPIAAESGEMAIAMLEHMARTSRLPSAILSDIQMPGMSGTALAERLYAEPQTAGIPVIVVTGGADTDQRLTPNVRGLVRKPFGRRQLLDELRVALGEPRSTVREAA
jgi:CheY-like chemotaxis protein